MLPQSLPYVRFSRLDCEFCLPFELLVGDFLGLLVDSFYKITHDILLEINGRLINHWKDGRPYGILQFFGLGPSKLDERFSGMSDIDSASHIRGILSIDDHFLDTLIDFTLDKIN